MAYQLSGQTEHFDTALDFVAHTRPPRSPNDGLGNDRKMKI